MKKNRIRLAQITLSAELADIVTAEEIWKHLPFEANVNVWGDEIVRNSPCHTITGGCPLNYLCWYPWILATWPCFLYLFWSDTCECY